MSTYDNRLDALERRVTSLEIQRLHNENMTILLGVIGKQGQDIKVIKEDVTVLKEDVTVIKERLEEHTILLTQILARLPEKP